jgi:hypothetical protein
VTFLIAPKFGAENTGTYNAKNTEKSKKSQTPSAAMDLLFLAICKFYAILRRR